MVITIAAPNWCLSEIDYVVRLVFGDFLGIEYALYHEERDNFEIRAAGGTVQIDASFFEQANKFWLKEESLPKKSSFINLPSGLRELLNEEFLPVLYGDAVIITELGNVKIGFDLLGTIFFMLSRYEEYFPFEADVHNRFTSKNSIASKLDFIDRPIVNELVEVLFFFLSTLDKHLIRKTRKFERYISADVDNPFLPSNTSIKILARRLFGDFFIRRTPLSIFNTLISYLTFKLGSVRFDRYMNCIYWMMDENDKVGNKVVFYFIADNSGHSRNGVYSLRSEIIQRLMKDIASRGHKLGIHGSFNTYRDQSRFIHEKNELLEIISNLEIPFDYDLENRQHYLRWDVRETNKILASAGVGVDNTLGFNDRIGFRAGCCYSYDWYDCCTRKLVDIRVRPLIVMDCSAVISMGLSSSADCQHAILDLKKKCARYNGEFTLLWHNSFFDSHQNRHIYKEAIR
jgi:hypothetical protein